MKVSGAIGFALLLFTSLALAAEQTAEKLPPPPADTSHQAPSFEHVAKKLRKKRVSQAFIRKLVKASDDSIQEKIIRLNMFGFLKKGDYSGNISTLAIRKCREFMKENRGALAQAQKKYKVPKEVITALLWVETKHGKIMGKLSVANVYMNLAMADHPRIVRRSLEMLKEEVAETDPQYAEYVKKVRERSKTKSDWAVDQLLALARMRKHWDVLAINGSFAGAFGFPQFIPSSYLESAAGPVRKGKRDLFQPSIAIHSVGNYLKQKGWGKGRKKREEALYAYNRSREYGSTILELADLIQPE